MTYLYFISITGAVGIIGALLLSLRAKWPGGRILAPFLAILFLGAGVAEYFASFDNNLVLKGFLTRLSLIFHFLIGVSMLELTVGFLGKEGIGSPFTINSRPIRLRFIWRPLAVVALEAAVLLRWFYFININSDTVIGLNRMGEALFAVLFAYHLLTLYAIEKIFRNATTIQKRVFFLYIASAGLIAIGSIILIVRILFFRQITFEIVRIHAALCGIFFPGMLLGLTRYRLWEERIAIGRGMVYTSITILFFGLFLITLGILASAVRLLGIRFEEFEGFVILFTLLFIGILVVFSPNMRRTVTALSRKYIYKSKYDYRDQLLRLHAAHQTAGDVMQTIRAFIDNLRYTIIVEDAYLFVYSPNVNCYYCTSGINSSSKKTISFHADSPLVRLFADDTVSAICIGNPGPAVVKEAIESEKENIDKLSVTHLFAVKYEHLLMGILGIDSGRRMLDSEDLMLITILCESIGTVLFRDRIERERIEQKQFESFSHMASFIVHDIKNQVATLSLVTKNARENINNPDFHPVLLRSLENCSKNLSRLIEKLQSPPKKELLTKSNVDCNAIVADIVEQTRNILPKGIDLRASLSNTPLITADPTALSFILKNLIINAIEAIGKEGVIECTTGTLGNMSSDNLYRFGISASDQKKYSVYITVEDNGPGMSRSFIEQRLFKPFNTTKDKGIGIGLYQCKTLLETMNGRLLCWSEEGKGARFCIIL